MSGEPPVIVLTAARSGSTLLRFLLDGHPEVCCPPETNLSSMAAEIVRAWERLDGEHGPTEDGATVRHHLGRDAARRAVGELMAWALGTSGKRLYCDKSLPTIDDVDLVRDLFPDARFLCLHRHAMDVIASAVDVSRWGFTNYGLAPYVATTPRNHVLGLARYWIDRTARIMSFTADNPSCCHRVRYEDLVRDPAAIMAGVFGFLGVPVGDYTPEAALRRRRITGYGDVKAAVERSVRTDRVGAGASVPVSYLPPSELRSMNELLESLGYPVVDHRWPRVCSGWASSHSGGDGS